MKKIYKLGIVYEDKNLIVVNKPSGMLTISTEKEKENTLYHKVLLYSKKKNKNSKIFIVNRIDKDTSGIVLFAKSQKLKNLFQNNWDKLVKYRGYIAIVEGEMLKDKDIIKSWLKETSEYKTYSSNKESDGKYSVTKYRKVVSNKNYNLLEIEILTGRKNQIRVHLSDIGKPIIGDKKYGSKVNPIKRLGLHANKLILINPINNREMAFETDIPKEFLNMFN